MCVCGGGRVGGGGGQRGKEGRGRRGEEGGKTRPSQIGKPENVRPDEICSRGQCVQQPWLFKLPDRSSDRLVTPGKGQWVPSCETGS